MDDQTLCVTWPSQHPKRKAGGGLLGVAAEEGPARLRRWLGVEPRPGRQLHPWQMALG